LGLRDRFSFPLVAGGHRRAADRLAELRDWSIGSFALGVRSALIWAVFEDAKRDISSGSSSELG
jgi:hypothetical protein